MGTMPMSPLPGSSPASPVRRALRRVVDPAVFDFWASHLSRTAAWERTLARVVAKRPNGAGSVTLLLRPNRHWQGCAAGQHVNVTVEIDGRRVTRSYSPTAPSAARDPVEITVKAIAGGRVSTHLCLSTQVGDVVELGTAFGEMTLPAASAQVLLLAAGSGITPMMAMLREWTARARRAPLTLMYWARTRDELSFVDELRAAAAAHDDLRVRFVLTRESAEAGDELTGRIDESQVADVLAGDMQAFACGPHGFVERARALLDGRVDSFVAEAFTAPPLPAVEGGTVRVALAMSGRTLQVPRGQPLLTALEDAGLQPRSGCRMGICNSCACGKRSGASQDIRTGDIDREAAASLRICVNSALDDLVLDL
ncbi:oxidoreductase [Lysobacter xinjiangensis]|uniref:Oxidoreductase n=1 Tax=Cognatilysobacter xinjiangensis TaxID=546892 RepID=A0ABQ3BVB8_9GAMM|nr:oxidoreductase [Lysobacter xinjiangensis]